MNLPELDFDPWDTPLKRAYDAYGYTPDIPTVTYTIYAANDCVHHGVSVMAGRPFHCRLCGYADEWVLEGSEKHQVFVCEHEPVQLTRGGLRQIDSVPARLVGDFDRHEPA